MFLVRWMMKVYSTLSFICFSILRLNINAWTKYLKSTGFSRTCFGCVTYTRFVSALVCCLHSPNVSNWLAFLSSNLLCFGWIKQKPWVMHWQRVPVEIFSLQLRKDLLLLLLKVSKAPLVNQKPTGMSCAWSKTEINQAFAVTIASVSCGVAVCFLHYSCQMCISFVIYNCIQQTLSINTWRPPLSLFKLFHTVKWHETVRPCIHVAAAALTEATFPSLRCICLAWTSECSLFQ